MNPLASLTERCSVAFQERGYRPDAEQRALIERLEQLRARLLEQSAPSLWRRWRRREAAGMRGLYIHGPVGRGKTLLMDLFFDSLPFSERRRSHFHHFMCDVHARLRALDGSQSPLETVAREWAKQCRVLCLDELFVSDIADAMILGGLLQALLDAGVVLVITSNSAPSELYRNGLQRSRFLPTIEVLEARLEQCPLDGGTDYRLQQLQRTPIYLDSALPDCDTRLQRLFQELAGGPADPRQALQLQGRTVPVIAVRGDLVWFDFAIICESSRSQNDYLELAEEFRTVMVSKIPRFEAPEQDDAARRLIALVDEFYDQGTKLIVSAAAPPLELYCQGRLRSEFERTASRLVEMQTPAYLARARRG